jgi:hypothetical protein
MYKTVLNKDHKPKTNIRAIMDFYDDQLQLKYAVAMQNKYRNPLYKTLMMREVDENGKPIYKTNIREIIERAEAEESVDSSTD